MKIPTKEESIKILKDSNQSAIFLRKQRYKRMVIENGINSTKNIKKSCLAM